MGAGPELIAVKGSGGVSAARSEAEGNYAWSWARTIWADSRLSACILCLHGAKVFAPVHYALLAGGTCALEDPRPPRGKSEWDPASAKADGRNDLKRRGCSNRRLIAAR